MVRRGRHLSVLVVLTIQIALEYTSSVAKSLHRSNTVLKKKHEALLARIPASPTPSTFASPTASPHFYTASLPRSNIGSLIQESPLHMQHPLPETPVPRLRTRKISVSPSDISLLSDQNTELLMKLEKLEAESEQADLAGKRKLKRLEKDIQLLKEELDRTRERNEEIEEKVKMDKALGKKERKERVRLLRGKASMSDDEDGSYEVRDFAPGGPLAAEPSSVTFSAQRLFEPESAPQNPSLDIENFTPNPVTPSPSPESNIYPLSLQPQQEYALVSQLLVKIQELEETNMQITKQQAETTTRLEAVQRDAETMGRVYECLGGQVDVEWEIVQEAEENEKQGGRPGDTGTIRFRSFRKTLEGDTAKALACGGETWDRQNDLNVGALPHKTRKSVMGFFDNPEGTEQEESDTTTPRTSFSSAVPFSKRPIDPHEDDTTNLENVPRSPTLSTLSILTPDSHILQQLDTPDQSGKTLGTELGGDEWSLAPGRPSHHFRTSSLYDLSRVDSPSPSESYHVTSPSPDEDRTPSKSNIQNRGSRLQMISQTIRTRTSRWVDGRLHGSMSSDGDVTEDQNKKQLVESASSSRTSFLETTPTRITTTIDHADTCNGATETQDGVPAEAPCLVSASVSATDSKAIQKRKRGITALLFELWIWLQFCMVILVFLWAIAKRGPKNVVKDADRRRAVGTL
jgi:hypothetical protein